MLLEVVAWVLDGMRSAWVFVDAMFVNVPGVDAQINWFSWTLEKDNYSKRRVIKEDIIT